MDSEDFVDDSATSFSVIELKERGRKELDNC